MEFMMKKIKIIALFGMAGAGKDACLHQICNATSFTHEVVSATTRPPREGEVNGVNYYFLSNKQFLEQEFIESTIFRDWRYGTPLSSLSPDYINVGVFNINGMKEIMKNDKLEVYPILVTASDKERLLRQLNREQNPDCDEIIRRYSTDKADFSELINLPFQYQTVINEGKTIEEVCEPIIVYAYDWMQQDKIVQ